RGRAGLGGRPKIGPRSRAVRSLPIMSVRISPARILMVHTKERARRIDAHGEEKAASQLAKLVERDPRWRLIHAIPVGDRHEGMPRRRPHYSRWLVPWPRAICRTGSCRYAALEHSGPVTAGPARGGHHGRVQRSSE